MNYADLIAKGYEKQADGTWAKRSAICAVEAAIAVPTAIQPLDKGIKKRKASKGSVAVLVTCITCRSREADDDNAISSIKPLRDAIAESLGIDDGDKRIKFQYGQCESRGQQGVIVKIERIA